MRRLRPFLFAGAITLLPISPFIASVADLTSALPLGPATLIASSINGARSVVTGDIDGDGDLDAVAASQDDGRVRWFENAAGNATSWTAHQIAVRTTASWAVVADVDRDGD